MLFKVSKSTEPHNANAKKLTYHLLEVSREIRRFLSVQFILFLPWGTKRLAGPTQDKGEWLWEKGFNVACVYPVYLNWNSQLETWNLSVIPQCKNLVMSKRVLVRGLTLNWRAIALMNSKTYLMKTLSNRATLSFECY